MAPIIRINKRNLWTLNGERRTFLFVVHKGLSDLYNLTFANADISIDELYAPKSVMRQKLIGTEKKDCIPTKSFVENKFYCPIGSQWQHNSSFTQIKKTCANDQFVKEDFTVREKI